MTAAWPRFNPQRLMRPALLTACGVRGCKFQARFGFARHVFPSARGADAFPIYEAHVRPGNLPPFIGSQPGFEQQGRLLVMHAKSEDQARQGETSIERFRS